jgi:hypothetical protein
VAPISLRFRCALAREVSVIGEQPAHLGGVGLIQQQLSSPAARSCIARALERRARRARRQCILIARLFGAQLARAARRRARRMQGIEPPAFRGDDSRSASRRRAFNASRCLSSIPSRLVSSAMRARTAASFARASAASWDSAAPPPQPARHITARERGSNRRCLSAVPCGFALPGPQAYKPCDRCYTCPPEKPEVFRMQRLLEFIGHHPYLAAGAVLAAIAVIFYEVRERVQSFAALSAMQAVRLMNQGALVSICAPRIVRRRPYRRCAQRSRRRRSSRRPRRLKKWRDKAVITYCDSGVSGAGAARTLMRSSASPRFSIWKAA